MPGKPPGIRASKNPSLNHPGLIPKNSPSPPQTPATTLFSRDLRKIFPVIIGSFHNHLREKFDYVAKVDGDLPLECYKHFCGGKTTCGRELNERNEFTGNYEDQRTDMGFRFEFKCDCYGSGYRTRFTPFTTGTITNASGTASNLFGWIFNQATQLGESARSASWQRIKDKAFLEAANELRPQFRQ